MRWSGGESTQDVGRSSRLTISRQDAPAPRQRRSERRRQSALASVRTLQTFGKDPPLLASDWPIFQNQAVKLYECTVCHVVYLLDLVDICQILH